MNSYTTTQSRLDPGGEEEGEHRERGGEDAWGGLGGGVGDGCGVQWFQRASSYGMWMGQGTPIAFAFSCSFNSTRFFSFHEVRLELGLLLKRRSYGEMNTMIFII